MNKIEELLKLKELLDSGIINESDFNKMKEELFDNVNTGISNREVEVAHKEDIENKEIIHQTYIPENNNKNYFIVAGVILILVIGIIIFNNKSTLEVTKNDNQSSYKTTTIKLPPKEETNNTKEKSINELNNEILNRYVDGNFIIQTFLKSPISYFSNGRISCLSLITKETNNESCIYNGTNHTKMVCFRDNGKLFNIDESIGGKRDGEISDFYDSGNVKFSRFYKGGQLNGKYLMYYENGQIQQSRNYNNGIPNGEILIYFSNGKLEKKAFCNEKGFETGNSIEYYDNGGKYSECNDEDGIRLCIFYSLKGEIMLKTKSDENGKKISKIEYNKNGIKEFNYDEEGNLIKE